MSDATKGDNRSISSLACDALTAVGDVRIISEHLASHLDRMGANGGRELAGAHAVVSAGSRSLHALAGEACGPLEKVYDWAWREEAIRTGCSPAPSMELQRVLRGNRRGLEAAPAPRRPTCNGRLMQAPFSHARRYTK